MSGGVGLYVIIVGVIVAVVVTVVLTTSSQASETNNKDGGIYLEILTTPHQNSDNTYTKTVRCGLNSDLAGMETVTGLTIKVSDPYSVDGVFYQLATVTHGENGGPQVMMEIEDSPPEVSGQLSQSGDLFSNLSLSWNFTNYMVGRSYKCVATGLSSASQTVKVSHVKLDDSELSIDAAQVAVVESVATRIEADVAETVDKQTDVLGDAIEKQSDQFDEKMDSVAFKLESKIDALNARFGDLYRDILFISRFDSSDVFNGKVYLASKQVTAFNIDSADQTCRTLGGYLVELNDDAEFFFVRSFVMGLSGASFFTGHNDIAVEGHYVHYRSGTPLVINKWATGQPDNAGSGEDCIEIRQVLDYYLNDLPCSYVSKYICEVPFSEEG